MLIVSLLITAFLSTASVTITEPVDGETYSGDWLTLRAIVENENEVPDSVLYILNGEPVIQIPRLNTDWPTYMQNDLHHGYSESPAPTDNTILWTAPVTGNFHEFPTPVVVDGIVYYPQDSSGDSLYALNAATGEIIWTYRTGYTDDAVTVKDGYLYTASDSIWCLDALTGQRIWASGDANCFGSTPAVVNGCVYCGTSKWSQNESYISSLDAFTGMQNWQTTITGITASCNTVWNDMVFVPTYQGALYALNASSGSLIWENSESLTGYWDSSPVIVDNMLYIGGDDSRIRCINPENGITVWEQMITPGTYIAATLAYADGKLYFGDQETSYHCLSAADGSSIWSVPGVEHGSSGIADGIVFFGEGSNYYDATARVFALDCETGQEIWSYETTSGPYGIVSSPSIVDGVVYIAGTDWNLYAFGTGLKYTFLDDFNSRVGSNELIVTSWDGGTAVAADTINFTVTGTGINLASSHVLNLSASPNPFVSSAAISFQLSEAGNTTVEIFDLSGRSVCTLIDSELSQGTHSIEWNGCFQTGAKASAGLYLCRIQSEGADETTGLCLLR
ncbi:MAG: PQQ-binding-like beta-propeller repeat protein [Candidatus Sabulitectum sp.]|nr:PQQ-binding-like beta-propeller repeat protein [Candidatus Sabulitectum sp.]